MATSDILALVQAAPDVGGGDGAYVAMLIESAKALIVDFCRLPGFPELSRGSFAGGTGARGDLTTVEGDTLLVSMHDGGFQEVQVDLAACTGGDASAAALEDAIRSAGTDDYIWTATEVSWDGVEEQYTITSPVCGEESIVEVSFDSGSPELAVATRLATEFAGRARRGSERCEALEVICAHMVIDAYRRAAPALDPLDDTAAVVAISELRGLFGDDAELRLRLLAHRRLFG